MERSQVEQYNNHAINTVFHEAGGEKVVIFCHGYRSSSIGPNRFFVRAARELAAHGISSLRFDQYGSGNSEGDFFDSSFNDWIATTRDICRQYMKNGYEVALFGQSMGGATVLALGSEMPNVVAIVAWVPDANVDNFHPPESGIVEEGGQIVQSSYWQEAHDMQVGDHLANIHSPVYIVQCTEDEYVDKENRDKIVQNAQPNHIVDTLEGYKHSSWTYEQSRAVIRKSVDFLTKQFDLKKL